MEIKNLNIKKMPNDQIYLNPEPISNDKIDLNPSVPVFNPNDMGVLPEGCEINECGEIVRQEKAK